MNPGVQLCLLYVALILFILWAKWVQNEKANTTQIFFSSVLASSLCLLWKRKKNTIILKHLNKETRFSACRVHLVRPQQRREFQKLCLSCLVHVLIVLIAPRTGLTNGFMASEQLRLFGTQINTHKVRGKLHKRPHSVMEAGRISESKLYIQIPNLTLPACGHIFFECPILM